MPWIPTSPVAPRPGRPRRAGRLPLAAAAIALAALAAPGACAKSAKRSAPTAAEKAAPPGGAPPPVKAGPGASPAGSPGAPSPSGAAPPDAGRLLVRTARLTIAPPDVTAAARQVEAIAARHGGYLHEGSLRAAGPETRWQGVLKIPPGQLGATLGALRALGQVAAESLSTEEITAAVLDVAARLRSLRTAERRYQELVEKRAGSVQELLAVEHELTRLRGDIERLEATARHHARAVAWATVVVRLAPAKPRIAEVGAWRRITLAFGAGLGHLRQTVVALVVAFGHLWPLALLLLTLAVVFFRIRRLLGRAARALFGPGVASPPPGPPPPAAPPQWG